PALAAVVDEAPDRLAEASPSLWARQLRLSPAGQPQDSDLPALLPGRAHSDRGQPLPFRAVCGTGPDFLQRDGPHRDVWSDHISSHWRAALLPHPGPPCLLLVHAGAAPC